MTNDNIVEGDETFSMSLNVPSSLGPGVVVGLITSATGIIIDSSCKCKYKYISIYDYSIMMTVARIRFAQAHYTGLESTGVIIVYLELIKGTSSDPFSVTVILSEQSPVSAEGNSVMCMIICVD